MHGVGNGRDAPSFTTLTTRAQNVGGQEAQTKTARCSPRHRLEVAGLRTQQLEGKTSQSLQCQTAVSTSTGAVLIADSAQETSVTGKNCKVAGFVWPLSVCLMTCGAQDSGCLLYTSDAADE